MARHPRQPSVQADPERQAIVSPLAAVYSSFDPARIGTGTSIVTLSNNNLTATAGTGATAVSTAATTAGDNTNVYFEVTINNLVGPGPLIGLINTNYVVNGNTVTSTTNSIGLNPTGSVYINNVLIGTQAAPTYVTGDTLGVAVNFPNKTIQFRNITQSGAWSQAYSFASITPTPFFFAASFNAAPPPAQSVTVNFDGTFLGTPLPGYARWHTAPTSPMTGPRDTFSEQPATVITVDALIAGGSFTPTGPTQQQPLTYSTIQFGAATLDTNGNLQFQDVIVDDPPLLVLTLSVATAPATITIYGAWDYGTPFVITTVNLPTTSPVTVTNIPILPPNYPQYGQGDILQLWLSSSTNAAVTWSNGHVYGTETVPIWPSVETAPIPPSITGRAYTLIPGTVAANFPAYTPLFPPPLVGQGGGAAPTFPPPTPPPIGAIPAGILVGPAIAAAAVPPSIAGKALIIFTFGSATTPSASAAFPQGTTTYPSPPIVFSNIYTGGATPTTPPSTASTPPLGGSYNTGGQWGPPIGPALPPVVPTGPRPFMVATNGNPDDVVYAAPTTDTEPNGEVYDDSDEENEDWVEETPHRTPSTPKPKRGRPRKR